MFRQVRDFIVYTNFWIALGSLSVTLSTYFILNIPLDVYVLGFVFFSTQLQYTILKYKGIPFSETNFSQWFHSHKIHFYATMIVSAIMSVFTFFHFGKLHLIVVVLAGIITLFYTGISSFQLRNYWFLKTPIVAFVWSILMVLLPICNMDEFMHLNIVLLFWAVFFLINGLTIPFEIKDLTEDSKVPQLKTVAMIMGIDNTLLFAKIHLVIAFILFLLLSWKLITLLPLILISYLVLDKTNERSPDYFFNFYIDGVLILMAPLSLLSNLI